MASALERARPVETIELQGYLNELKARIEAVEQDFLASATQHSLAVRQSFKEAFRTLFSIVKFVTKRENRIAYWIQEGETVSVISRLVGKEEAFQQRLAAKTQALQDHVASVEKDMRHCVHFIKEGTRIADRYRASLREFSDTDVYSVVEEAGQWIRKAKQEHHQIKGLLSTRSVELDLIARSQEGHDAEKRSAKRDVDDADNSLIKWKGVGGSRPERTVSLGALAVGTTVAASPFLLPAFGAIYFCHKKVEQIETDCADLRKTYDQARDSSAEAQALYKAHKEKTKSLKNDEESLIQVKATLAYWIEQAQKLHEQAEEAIEEARHTSMILQTLTNNLDSISKKLSECNYMDSRRGIGHKLRNIFNQLGDSARKHKFSLDEAKTKQLLADLAGIESELKHSIMAD